jgi:hypothetical protein
MPEQQAPEQAPAAAAAMPPSLATQGATPGMVHAEGQHVAAGGQHVAHAQQQGNPGMPTQGMPAAFPQPTGNLGALAGTSAPHGTGAEAHNLDGTALRLRPSGVASTGSAPGPGVQPAARRPRAAAQAKPQSTAPRAPGPAPRLKPRAAQVTTSGSGSKTMMVAGIFVGLTLLAGALVGKYVFNAF